MDSWCGIGATRRGPGGWRGRRPSILSLNFHSAPCIAVQRRAKFGDALPQPFVCLADVTRPMWIEFRVSVIEHCQRLSNCLGLAIPARRMDHCLPGCFNISAHQQSGGQRARDIGLGISSKLRRNLARCMMNSWCEAGAARATPGGWSGERGARRRGLRGERKAVVEAEDWEGPAFTGPVRASASILAGDRGQFERVVVHQFAISQRPLGQIRSTLVARGGSFCHRFSVG
jgi:hypothetical protein